MTSLHHLFITANNITAKPTNQSTQTAPKTLYWNTFLLDSDDDFC